MNIYEVFKYFNEFLNEEKEIKEKTAYKKRGIILPEIEEELSKYVDSGYFIHFGSINKLGVFPRSKYKNPVGIYCYPLIEEIFGQLISGKLPFAQEQENLILFTAKENANIIEIESGEDDFFQFEMEDYFSALKKLREMNYEKIIRERVISWGFDKEKLIETIERFFRDNEGLKEFHEFFNIKEFTSRPIPIGFLWYVCYKILKNQKVWNIFLRKIGIHGLVDYGVGLIHPSEPIQALFLTREAVEIERVFQNKLKPKQASARLEKRKIDILREEVFGVMIGDLVRPRGEALKYLELEYGEFFKNEKVFKEIFNVGEVLQVTSGDYYNFGSDFAPEDYIIRVRFKIPQKYRKYMKTELWKKYIGLDVKDGKKDLEVVKRVNPKNALYGSAIDLLSYFDEAFEQEIPSSIYRK